MIMFFFKTSHKAIHNILQWRKNKYWDNPINSQLNDYGENMVKKLFTLPFMFNLDILGPPRHKIYRHCSFTMNKKAM